MRQVIIKLFKNITLFPNTGQNHIGRWDLKDNSAIKATLANMDCCGDYHCGNPENYSKNIQEILKEEMTKIDL
tara:strand:- start:324 stop:542 length:219 start_codon:yes stop_codon:yes gene_type:complete